MLKFIKIEWLRKCVEQNERIRSPIVSAHNDLTAGNIIYDKNKEIVGFIDFEYSGYNFRGFDLANYFCEFAGLNLDFSLYPTKEQQLRFLSKYLSTCGVNKDDQNFQVELDNIYLEVNVFALSSHLLWGIWGILQQLRSTIEFDYIEYARKRFEEYFKHKKRIEAHL